MLRNTTTLGLVAMFGWCIISAIARVITGSVTQEIEPSVLCFYTFAFAMTIFMIFNITGLKKTFMQCKDKKNIKNIALLNVTTFGAWFFLMYPLKYIDPAMVSSITLGLGPLATIALGFLIYESYTYRFFDTLIAFLLFCIILFITYLSFTGIATRGHPTTFNIIFAITSCFIVGFTSAAGNLYAKALSDNQFEPSTILIVRFPLIVFLAALISMLSRHHLALNAANMMNVIIVSGSLVIIPLYLAQLGIKHLDPIVVAIIAPLMPAFVFIAEYISSNSLNESEAISVALTCFLILLSTFVRYRKRLANVISTYKEGRLNEQQ